MKYLSLILSIIISHELCSQTVYPTYIKVNNVQTPTTFITQTNLNVSVRASVGYNYGYLKDRFTIYGGNLNVSQSIASSNDYLGKWSTIGAWQMLYNTGMVPMNVPIPVTPGINYLVNYHRWGNYDAHFGLRERMSDIGVYSQTETGGGPTFNDPNMAIKDAVLSFSYENGATPSRFIIQSIQGIDAGAMRAGSGVYPVATELATVLSNGNFGLGVSNPTAKLQIMTNTGFTNDYLRISNPSGAVMVLNNAGNLGIGTGSPTAKFHIFGNNSINGDLIKLENNGAVKFQFQNNGNMAFNSTIDPSLNVQYYFQGNGSYTTFHVTNDKAESLFQLNNNGGLMIAKLAEYYKVPSNEFWNLKIGQNGQIVADLDPNGQYNQQAWSANGNSFGTSTIPLLGTKTHLDFSLISGGVIFGSVIGKPLATLYDYRGSCAFSSSISIGSDNFNKSIPQVDPQYALTLYSTMVENSLRDNNQYSLWGERGLLHCINDAGGTAFSVGNDAVRMNNNRFVLGATGCFLDAKLSFGERKGIEMDGAGIMPLGTSLNADDEDIGSSANQWDEIWGKVISAQTLAVSTGVTGDLIPSYVNSGFKLGDPGARWEEVFSVKPLNSRSDLRFKTNVQNLEYGLREVLRLKPITFDWKINPNGKRIGFIAQDVVKVLPEVVTIDSLDQYGMYYSEIIPVLTKAIQELYLVIDSLKNENYAQRVNFNSMAFKDTIQKLMPLSYLLQNKPNPFSGITYLDYYVSESSNSYILRVVNNEGKLIKAIQIKNKGYGQIALDGTELTSGLYHCTLIVDGIMVDTKSIVIEKQ